jgi:hypothetical protein
MMGMTKCAIIVFGVSVAAAAYEIHRLGSFAGLGIGIVLLPAFVAAQFIFAKWLMGNKRQ